MKKMLKSVIDICFSMNQMLFNFSLIFMVTVAIPLSVPLTYIFCIRQNHKHIFLIPISLLLAIPILHASHVVYVKYARPIILRNGYLEDSLIDSLIVMSILACGVLLPTFSGFIFLVKLFH